MGTKNISIMDDAYDILLSHKKTGESFSEVIRREISKKNDIKRFAGIWSDMSKKEAENMKKNINELRKNTKFDRYNLK